MQSLFGIQLPTPVVLAIAFAVIFALLAIFAMLLRKLSGTRLNALGAGGRGRQPRLGLVDAFDLDRQRQLVIVRRDHVEHLVMIGGPNDIVIETNIVRGAASAGRDLGEARIEPRMEPGMPVAPPPVIPAAHVAPVPPPAPPMAPQPIAPASQSMETAGLPPLPPGLRPEPPMGMVPPPPPPPPMRPTPARAGDLRPVSRATMPPPPPPPPRPERSPTPAEIARMAVPQPRICLLYTSPSPRD